MGGTDRLKLAAAEPEGSNLYLRSFCNFFYFAGFILQSGKGEKLGFSLSVSEYYLHRVFLTLS
jgi:hypothetical protein